MGQLQMKWNMLRRWANIVTGKSVTAVAQTRGRYFQQDAIRGYYNDLTGKVNCGTPLDSSGLPLTQIGENTFVYFPIAVFQYGLGMYDLLLAQDPYADREVLRKIADWALENQRPDGSWDCFGPLKSRYYTISSMGQGEGASFLFRMAVLFDCSAYREAAFRAIDFMLLPMEKGGTALYDADSLFLEEYPQTPRRSVLNGWIFSAFGLYDAAIVKPERYADAFQKTVRTMADHLKDYDTGFWSFYDISGRIASPAYHDLHIALLEVMHELTGVECFSHMAERFRLCQENKLYHFRAVVMKIMQKLTEKSDAVVIR